MKLIISDIKDLALRVIGEHKIIKPTEKTEKHCIGCFGCWVKTPGECVIKDGIDRTGCDMGKCENLIMISECLYGGFSDFVKKVQDRAISYVRGDFEPVDVNPDDLIEIDDEDEEDGGDWFFRGGDFARKSDAPSGKRDGGDRRGGNGGAKPAKKGGFGGGKPAKKGGFGGPKSGGKDGGKKFGGKKFGK